jgi:hypothetical protein
MFLADRLETTYPKDISDIRDHVGGIKLMLKDKYKVENPQFKF